MPRRGSSGPITSTHDGHAIRRSIPEYIAWRSTIHSNRLWKEGNKPCDNRMAFRTAVTCLSSKARVVPPSALHGTRDGRLPMPRESLVSASRVTQTSRISTGETPLLYVEGVSLVSLKTWSRNSDHPLIGNSWAFPPLGSPDGRQCIAFLMVMLHPGVAGLSSRNKQRAQYQSIRKISVCARYSPHLHPCSCHCVDTAAQCFNRDTLLL